MTGNRAIALCSAALVLGAASGSNVQAQRAAIEGVARAEDSGRPVAFALVRLVPADTTKSRSDTPPQGITTADGRYRFVDVPAGQYRVLLLRIGFRPVLSEPVQVAGGETVQLPLRVASLPIVLPTVIAAPEVCLKASELSQYPQIQTLWQQARDGAAVRTEIMARFRYRVQTYEATLARKDDGTPVGFVDQSWISDPGSAVRNAARRRSERLSRGYYGPTNKNGAGFFVPNELDVLHEDFLKEHCVEAAARHGPGEIGLRFLPARQRPNLLDVAGTIWLDSATLLARRIDLDYVDGDDHRGTVRLDFGDVAVVGGTLRMPVGGDIDMRPSRTDPARHSLSRFTITYADFVEVRRRQAR
jgi:hypothetical protein